jgi:hypothetical protein
MSKEEKPDDDLAGDNNRVQIKSIDEALGSLFANLEEANRLFVAGKDAGRNGAIEALNAVVQFLLFFDGTTHLRQPLTALINALVSLNDGQVLPLLERQRRSGRSPASAARENDMATAAFIVHRLCQTGVEPNEAYERVAKVCREAGVKPARKGTKNSPGQEAEVTGRTVRYWCDKIKADIGCRSPAAQTFKRLTQSQTRGAHAIRQATPNALLDSLGRSLAQMRASEH